MSNHLGLDFDLVEFLARVDTNDATNHLRDNDHVSEMSLDEIRLLVWLRLLLRLAQLLDQTHRLALETTVEPTAGTSVNDIAELVGGKVQESVEVNIGLAYLLPFEFSKTFMYGDFVLVEVDSTVGKLSERSLLLDLGGGLGVLFEDIVSDCSSSCARDQGSQER